MIKEATFEETLELWKELWPDRKSEIEPISAMELKGGINLEILKNNPTFFIWYEDNKAVGCNSGFQTGYGRYRSRGIYVKPEYRGKNIAYELMLATENKAKKEGCKIFWSIPRKQAIAFYESFGFKRVSDWFDEGMEFGPNCYVVKRIYI